MLQINDPVYGAAVITEPVLIEVLQSSAMRRLRGVLQHGISGLLGITSPISRYEHSVGVMLLVRRLGGPLVEQIAALLHDVSHTAFSHVIDYVFDNHDGQSYHEEVKEAYLAGSDLPPLLARYGYDWREFLHDEGFPLLEQPAPALCADRLDYGLRDAQDLGLVTAAQAQRALAHLMVYQGRIVMDDAAVAVWLADTYMAADDASWSDFREVGLYELTAQAIWRGLETGVISRNDFWTTDAVLWARLNAGTDPQLQRLLRLVHPQTRFVWDDANPTFRISTKIRTIDPDVWQAGQLRPLSALDPAYARRRQAYLARKSGKWPMRVAAAEQASSLV